MLLQESFIRPLYDRLPFLSISLRSGSSASDAGGAGWDRRVVSESNSCLQLSGLSAVCSLSFLVFYQGFELLEVSKEDWLRELE